MIKYDCIYNIKMKNVKIQIWHLQPHKYAIFKAPMEFT